MRADAMPRSGATSVAHCEDHSGSSTHNVASGIDEAERALHGIVVDVDGATVRCRDRRRHRGISGLGLTPTETITRSTSMVSMAPGMGTGGAASALIGLSQLHALIFMARTCPRSSPRYSTGLASVRSSIPPPLRA